ncbi:hypothetical protein [Faecalicatena fissicatena]|uniref:hypothetical protein n=1 Tax=Faecalicatena fissicatena TaxID=290055 RepID=UPI0029F4C250|nr:hypothetical protein [Faecalicatena fissicatena]
MPDDRTFLDEIRSALQIEKFIRFDATNTVTQFESIKEAKKVEMRERNGAAKLFLSESLKNAEIYVNGDKIQSGAKEIASKINEALGKLVSTVYHKLSYIDTAMSESDIHTLFKNNGQQLTLVGTNITKNELALYDVNDYIALNTQRHMKTSMKSILERFLKAPYGFVEADVQWLVAKLFKNGEIAMFVNNDAVTLLSKTSEEIIRYLTRKEFNEKLMTEKRVKANEKQKKSVRTVMKELFNVTSASDDDDAIMRSFLGYASSLAEIALVSLTSKITNLITTLDFVQTEPVSDIVKETSYRVYFISDSNEKISNENIVIADKKDKDTTKRMFRLRFNFKNKKYDKSQKYYLVAYDDKNDIEVLRHEIIMDIAFADDFGFFT